MARQPVSPFAGNDFDPYAWFTTWLKERERYRSWLIVEMHEPLKVGDEVSVVAIAKHWHPDMSESIGWWGLCLVAESLTTSTASRLTDALSMLQNRQGLDAEQGLAFLVQSYLLWADGCRAIVGDRSVLFETPWEQCDDDTKRREKIAALKHRPLWQLQMPLDYYWSNPEKVSALFFSSPDGSPGQTLYLTIPPRWLPLDEFRKIYGQKAERTNIPGFTETTLEPLLDRLERLERVVGIDLFEHLEHTIRAVLHKEVVLSHSDPVKSGTELTVSSQEGDFRHSSDFRSVSLRGELFSLTSSQAQVVERLYEAYKNGTPEVGQDTLIVGIELQSHRLHDVFKSRPEAWGKLIIQGKTRGSYRLNL